MLFVSPYGSSMTFVTIPMHFIPAGLLEFVFCALCFLNSFSKKGCYKDTFLMWVATYLMMAFRSQSYVLSPSNGTALRDSKVKQYILILNVSVLGVWVKSSTAQNLMRKCQKLIGRFTKSNWAPSPARSWQKSLMWHYDVIECHRDWVQTDWMWSNRKTSSMREHWCQDKIQGRWHVS